MDKEKISHIINLFTEHNLNKLIIKEKDFQIEIEKAGKIASSETKTEKTKKSTGISHNEVPTYKVRSPVVGVYYESSSPDLPPFVKKGDRVKQGDTVCIIEAMKMINEISAPVSGIISKVHFNNEDIVEYDDILMEIIEDV